MLNSVLGYVKNGKIEFSEQASLTEGARVLVTFLPLENEDAFWLSASESSLKAICNHPEDDTYAQLLQE